MGEPPKSRLGRLARLGSLTTRVGASYLGQQVRELLGRDTDADRDAVHIDNARRVAEALGGLKGAAMKLGQAVAVGLEGMDVPPEVKTALGKLHDKGEPVPFDVIRREVERELGQSLDVAFDVFEREPLGTASLGQAHGATLHDGTSVVVKVLHRGIDQSVGADLGALRAVFLSSRILRRDRSEVDAIFDELRERLEEELDYLKEAENLDFFRRALAMDKAIRIPATVPSHCTRRVLTMYRMPGKHIDQFLETATPAAQQRAGLTVARCFHRMLYDVNALHADPHPGNYLFEPDGTVGLVDFGCVKRFDRAWVRQYAKLAVAVIDKDKPAAIVLGQELGCLAPNFRPQAAELMYEMADVICDPFRRGPYTAGSGDDNVQAKLKAMAPRVILYPELRSPRNMVFLHRALGGMYAMVRKLKTRADWGVMLKPWLDQAVRAP